MQNLLTFAHLTSLNIISYPKRSVTSSVETQLSGSINGVCVLFLFNLN